MSDAMSEAMEGLMQATTAYLQKAQAELKATTDKMAAGPLTADDVVDAMARMSALWVNGLASAAVETFDAAVTLAKYAGSVTRDSDPASVGSPGAWSLAVTGPFVAGKGAELPVAELEVIPTKVESGDSHTFVVRCRTKYPAAGVYVGTVTATNAAGKTKQVDVKIVVP
jgi:hypothetical protein